MTLAAAQAFDSVLCFQALDHVAKLSAINGTKLKDNVNDAIAIDGVRVVLQVNRGPNEPTPTFSFQGPVMNGNVKGAVPLQVIAGNYADKNSDIVSAAPLITKVRSQFLIGVGGSFDLYATDSPPKLNLPGGTVPGGSNVTIDVAEGLFMGVDHVTRARLLILPLSDSTLPLEIYPIMPASTGEANLLLAQTCRTGDLSIGSKDQDFQYHYMLLDSAPPGPPLPIVEKFSGSSKDDFIGDFLGNDHPHEQIKPHGCNCAGAQGLARPYDSLDKFMNITGV